MITLPKPIAAYVAASNAQQAEQVSHCFTPDATVHDEGSVLRGRAEIAHWAHESGTRYRATMQPLAIDEAEGRSTVRATVRGDFPGSPLVLAFHFTLAADGIANLEITA